MPWALGRSVKGKILVCKTMAERLLASLATLRRKDGERLPGCSCPG